MSVCVCLRVQYEKKGEKQRCARDIAFYEKKEREWTFCKAIEKAQEFREAIKLASSLKTTERESRETMLKKKINLGLVRTQKNVTSGEEV